MRKRVVAVHNLRRQHGQHLFLKIFFYELLFLLLKLFKVKTAHTVGLELLFDLRIRLVALFVKRRHCPVDRVQLLHRRHPRSAVHFLIIHSCHIIKTAYPDHEKFVQIARKYGDKLHSLHERNTLISGFLQHSLVKPEPGQFPVLRIIQYFLLTHSFFLPLIHTLLIYIVY